MSNENEPKQVQLEPAVSRTRMAPHAVVASNYLITANLLVVHIEFGTTRLVANGTERDLVDLPVVDVEIPVAVAEALHRQLGEYLAALEIARRVMAEKAGSK